MLMSNVKQNAVFGRYMPICPPPTHPVPRTICLDFQLENCTLMTTDGTPCELKVPALNVQEELVNNKLHYRVSLTFDDGRGRTIQSKLQIDYQDTKKRFWFSHVEGASIRACGDGETESKQKYLAEFLNHRQETVLIGLDGGEIVYQARSFYKIDYKHAEQNLLGLIEHLQTVSPCYSEKGTKEQIDKLKSSVSTKFLPDTLFRAIADDKIPLPFDSELIICFDLVTECADFIIANFTERKLALIHAKAGKGRKIPAADWHEVVAQAMKNLAYLTPNAETPDRATSWRAVAKWNKTNILILQKKPATCPEGVPLWKMIRKEIIENANAELYVALVTTGIVSINALTDAVNNPKKRTPETAQLFHLLDGLNGHTRQLGVRLKIYDIPYKK